MASWKDVAKKLAQDTLGEDSVESLEKIGKSAIAAGKNAAGQVSKSIKESDNTTIKKARNIVNAVKTAANEDSVSSVQTREKIHSEAPSISLTAATCPNCGATLEVADGIDTMYCQFCGTKVIINNQDAATLKAKENIKKLEHQEVMADKVMTHLNARSEKKAAEREKQRKSSNVAMIFMVIILVCSMGYLLIKSNKNDKAEQEQDTRFQAIVLEIEEDIKNEDYDSALIKANQLYLVTDTPIGNETKKKWGNTREALIEQIEELKEKKEKEAYLEESAIPEDVLEPEAVPDSENVIDENTEAEASETNLVYYSTNDKNTVKNGNTGVYAYKSKGGSYSIYYIINFDEGCVYYFCHGNGDTICDRVKIDYGDLNSVLVITYHDGNDSWQYGLHFNWKNQPETLIVQDTDGYEDKFYATDLEDALNLLQSKSITDY